MEIKTITLDRCPICDSVDIVETLQSRDFESGTGNYSVFNCKACDSNFTNPRPTEESLPKLYESRSSADFPKPSYLVSSLRKWVMRTSISSYLKFVEGTDLSVLDFGCGDGFFSVYLAEQIRISQVIGVDFHHYPPPLLVESGDLSGKRLSYLSNQNLVDLEKKFDVIFLRHVLEHSIDPVKLLEKLSQLLKLQGVLVIEVPNYGSAWRKIFNRYYFGLYLPRHLHHFSQKSISVTLKTSHLNIKSLLFKHTPLIPKSLEYMTGIRLNNVSILGILLFPVQFLVDRLVGASTVISVVACRAR